MSNEASAEPVLPKRNSKSNKDYSSVTRVYDSDGYRLRSDALCFKDEHKQEVHQCKLDRYCMITSVLEVHQCKLDRYCMITSVLRGTSV